MPTLSPLSPWSLVIGHWSFRTRGRTRGAALAALAFLFAADLLAQQYVAVGYGGRRMSSADGKTWGNVAEWKAKGGDDSDNLMSIATGLGKFVVVGGGGFSKESQKGHILVSTDGKEWKPAGEWPNRVNPVVFGGKRFVAAGGGETRLLYSDDGLVWKKGAEVKTEGASWAFWFRRGVYGNGRYLLFGDHGSGNPRRNFLVATRDGTSVEKIDYDFPGLSGAAFGNGAFVLLTREGKLLLSKDGLDWKESGDVGAKPAGLAFNGRIFVTGTGDKLLTSADGAAWKPAPGAKLPGSLLAARDAHLIVGNWPGKLSFSTDGGKTWTRSADTPTENGLNAVAFGPAR